MRLKVLSKYLCFLLDLQRKIYIAFILRLPYKRGLLDEILDCFG